MTVLRRGSMSRDVTDWRRTVLRQAGFAPALAAELATDTRVDLHQLLDLVDRGCPPALAARILAPLDAGPAPPALGGAG